MIRRIVLPWMNGYRIWSPDQDGPLMPRPMGASCLWTRTDVRLEHPGRGIWGYLIFYSPLWVIISGASPREFSRPVWQGFSFRVLRHRHGFFLFFLFFIYLFFGIRFFLVYMHAFAYMHWVWVHGLLAGCMGTFTWYCRVLRIINPQIEMVGSQQMSKMSLYFPWRQELGTIATLFALVN